MEWGTWELVPFRGEPRVLAGRLLLFWETVSRNIDRARRAQLRPRVSPDAVEIGPIASKRGAILCAPADDEIVPGLADGAFSLHSPFGPFESPSDSDDFHGSCGRAPGGQTPKGTGEKLGPPSPQRPRADPPTCARRR